MQESRALAEIAKAELDDTPLKGRPLRVRFATHSAALSVKNLSPFVSNELLEEAFLQFGMVERAIVIVDDRGRSTGRGIVEFASKPAARKALERCNEGCMLLTTSVYRHTPLSVRDPYWTRSHSLFLCSQVTPTCRCGAVGAV